MLPKGGFAPQAPLFAETSSGAVLHALGFSSVGAQGKGARRSCPWLIAVPQGSELSLGSAGAAAERRCRCQQRGLSRVPLPAAPPGGSRARGRQWGAVPGGAGGRFSHKRFILAGGNEETPHPLSQVQLEAPDGGGFAFCDTKSLILGERRAASSCSPALVLVTLAKVMCLSHSLLPISVSHPRGFVPSWCEQGLRCPVPSSAQMHFLLSMMKGNRCAPRAAG